MHNPENLKKIDEIRNTFAQASAAYVYEIKGLSVEDQSSLRRRIKDSGGTCKVFKNTWCAIAVKDTPFEGLIEHLEGPNAFVFGAEDPIAVIKSLFDFQKETKKDLGIKAGSFEGVVYHGQSLEDLTKLPSKDQMRGMLLSTFMAGARNFVSVVSAPTRGLLTVISRKAEC